MMINEQIKSKWKGMISETTGQKFTLPADKLDWMSEMAMIHEAQQSTASTDGGIYTTPLNTMGMGNPMMPQGVGFAKGSGIGNTGSDFHSTGYGIGSGDLPMSTLPIALEVAAMAIGTELVPVVPAAGPYHMLTYMDFPYAGGKLGRLNETAMDGAGANADNKPIYVKVSGNLANIKTGRENWAEGELLTFTATTGSGDDASTEGTFKGTFIGTSRIDGNLIVEVKSCQDGSGNDISLADFFSVTDATYSVEGTVYTTAVDLNPGSEFVRPELVSGAADHVQGFSNFTGESKDPMTRAQNETGVGNTIGARMFSKMIQMGSYEVTGSVTRQQLQDMPVYGVDVLGKVIERMKDQIAQEISNRILDRVFKLGTTNAVNQFNYQGINLNLYLGGTDTTTGKATENFTCASKFIGIDDEAKASVFGTTPNSNIGSYENVITNQRRISSRMLGAANLIAQISRRGRGQWAVVNTRILTALQDVSGFMPAPMVNTLTQDGSKSLYFAGSIAGLNLYVDPYMTWDDTRICIGKRASEAEPGVVFMPYILADTIQTLVEGTMAPKLLVNSRFAIVDAGFYPEQSYYTIMIDTETEAIL